VRRIGRPLLPFRLRRRCPQVTLQSNGLICHPPQVVARYFPETLATVATELDLFVREVLGLLISHREQLGHQVGRVFEARARHSFSVVFVAEQLGEQRLAILAALNA
jgi:hypothetical protein